MRSIAAADSPSRTPSDWAFSTVARLAVDVELEGPHEDKKCSLGQILHFNISDMLKFKV